MAGTSFTFIPPATAAPNIETEQLGKLLAFWDSLINVNLNAAVGSLNTKIDTVKAGIAANMNEAQYSLSSDTTLANIVASATGLQKGRNYIRFTNATDFQVTGIDAGGAIGVGAKDLVFFDFEPTTKTATNINFLDDSDANQLAVLGQEIELIKQRLDALESSKTAQLQLNQGYTQDVSSLKTWKESVVTPKLAEIGQNAIQLGWIFKAMMTNGNTGFTPEAAASLGITLPA